VGFVGSGIWGSAWAPRALQYAPAIRGIGLGRGSFASGSTVIPSLLNLGLIGLYSIVLYLIVGGKEKIKKKYPSARKGSPDYIHTCSNTNILTL